MKVIQFCPDAAAASGVNTFATKVDGELRAQGVDSRIVREADGLPRLTETPDVLHIHGMWLKAHHQAAAWAKRAGVPVVWSTHGMTSPWSMHHKWWKKRPAWWLYQKSDLKASAALHCTSEQERDWNVRLGLGNRQVLIPLGTEIDGEWQGVTGRTRPGGRVSMIGQDSSGADGVRPDEVEILFVGRVYPVKGLMNLVRAAALLRKRASCMLGTRKVCFRVVGPDQAGHLAELQAECDRLGVAWSDARTDVPDASAVASARTDAPDASAGVSARTDVPDASAGVSARTDVSDTSVRTGDEAPVRVVFAGPRFGAELKAEYAACDLLVLPSFTENFGGVVVDALAYGKPVIASRFTPWRELAGKGCGWWVDNAPESLAKTVSEAVLAPSETLAKMGREGRTLVEEKYTWAAVARNMVICYNTCL